MSDLTVADGENINVSELNIRSAHDLHKEDLNRQATSLWNKATGNQEDPAVRIINKVTFGPISLVDKGPDPNAVVIKILEGRHMTEEQKVKALPEQSARSLDIGIIGVGGAGNHIADAFAEAGYDAMVVNLTDRDYSHLTNIPNDENSRMELIVGAGGAGKNPDVGADAVRQYAKSLVNKIQKKFNNKEFLFVACGLGGGTGTLGGVLVAEIAASLNIPVGMIVTLPRTNEGTDEKVNCLRGLQEIANHKGIKSIVVIDNQRVLQRLSGSKDSDFWTAANKEIVRLFDTFNRWSAVPSNTAFDAEDYKKCLMTPGFLELGSQDIDTNTISAGSTEAQLKEAVDSISKGYLASGFDHKTAVRAAGVIVKPTGYDYAHSFEESLFDHLKSEIGAGGLNRGIYSNEAINGFVLVHTMLAGMKLPAARVQELVSEAKAEASEMSKKIQERLTENIKIDIPTDFGTVSGTPSANKPQSNLGRRR